MHTPSQTDGARPKIIFTPTMIRNLLIWNCSGAASKSFNRTVKDMIQTFKPDLIGMVETKISGGQADKVCNKLGLITGYE